MQRDNIRMLNENYAEKSGKYKQIAGLPVDNTAESGIIKPILPQLTRTEQYPMNAKKLLQALSKNSKKMGMNLTLTQ